MCVGTKLLISKSVLTGMQSTYYYSASVASQFIILWMGFLICSSWYHRESVSPRGGEIVRNKIHLWLDYGITTRVRNRNIRGLGVVGTANICFIDECRGIRSFPLFVYPLRIQFHSGCNHLNLSHCWLTESQQGHWSINNISITEATLLCDKNVIGVCNQMRVWFVSNWQMPQ